MRLVDSSELSLLEKIAQLVFPRVGSNLPPVKSVSEDSERVAEMLQQVPIGGLCLFNGEWPHTPRSLAELQAASRYPLLIAADVERGVGQQVKGLTVFPDAMAFGAQAASAEPANRTEATQLFGQATGDQALAAGIHLVLGPVADVNSDPRNPIIATRAFSTDTGEVAELAAAYVRGCQSTGAHAVAKHFPGHGNTIEDSHAALPRVDGDRQLLGDRDIAPFQAAIAAGVRCIMTAHVAYPGLDASGVPATISRAILTDLLRGELGFDGVIMTDSLLMAGVRDRFDDEATMAQAVMEAGADILLDVADPVGVVAALTKMVEEGTISESRIDESFRRVWKLKADLLGKLGDEVFVGNDVPDSPRVEAEVIQVAKMVAAGAITELGSAQGETIGLDQRIGVVIVKPFDVPWDTDEQPLVTAVREITAREDLPAWQISPQHGDADEIVNGASDCDHLIVAMIVRPVAWHKFGLPDDQKQLIDRLALNAKITLVSLGIPAILDQFPQVDRRICAFSNVEASQRAVAEYLMRE